VPQAFDPPLKKGEKTLKVPLKKGDLGGSTTILALFQRCVYTVGRVRDSVGGVYFMYLGIAIIQNSRFLTFEIN
jgi:hypothetical protein